jgi:hypothetical protein
MTSLESWALAYLVPRVSLLGPILLAKAMAFLLGSGPKEVDFCAKNPGRVRDFLAPRCPAERIDPPRTGVRSRDNVAVNIRENRGAPGVR